MEVKRKVTEISEEARDILSEIIEHEGDNQYWQKRFDSLSRRDDTILRGCFKELRENGLINTEWADNYPYIIHILKDGYLYDKHIQSGQDNNMTNFERELNELLERTKNIKSPINAAPITTNIDEYNRPSIDWLNDAEIFQHKYLKTHPLGNRIKSILFHRQLQAYDDLVSCFKSISRDQDYILKMRGQGMEQVVTNKNKEIGAMYDVFLSHANIDKIEIIDNLYSSLESLGINIFYDKKSLEWGDKWKDRILDGVQKADFAIIVISENFFDREWTEKELKEFLNRQNKKGQKIILPVVHNITMPQLKNKYPDIADIQAIDSKNYTSDQIALLFAGQLIKRLKS